MLRTLSGEGQEIFLIEQNLRFATQLGDEILAMVNGRIAADCSMTRRSRTSTSASPDRRWQVVA